MEKTFLEFFAGIGLVRIGLEKEGWKCVFANDNDPEKVRIYRDNFFPSHLDNQDIRSLKPKDVPFARLATASFPCQDLSEAGPHNGIHGPRSGVFWQFADILHGMSESKPCLVLLENVKGFLTEKSGKNLLLAINALNELGYICDVLVLDGKYFVAQSRPRVFVVGILGKARVPSELMDLNGETKEHSFRPNQVLQLIRDNPELKWFRLKLPPPPEVQESLEQILDSPQEVPRSYWFSNEETERHLKMMPRDHKDKIESLRLQHSYSAVTMYRRMRKGEQKAELRFDGIAGCLRAARGGSSKQFVVIVDKGEIRMRKLTVRELRRLMGLPKNFYLPDDYNVVYRALGDAVIVPVVEWIARNILNPLWEGVSQTKVALKNPL